MSKLPTWDDLPLYPDPTDLEAALAGTAVPEEFDYSEKALLYSFARDAWRSEYARVAEQLFKDPPTLPLLTLAMKAMEVAMRGKKYQEWREDFEKAGYYQLIVNDLLAQANRWDKICTDRKSCEVFMHYALECAAKYDDVDVAGKILNIFLKDATLSFLEKPIYAATAHGSADVLALLLDAVFNRPHEADLFRISQMMSKPQRSNTVQHQLHIHKMSIIAEALTRVPAKARDKSVTVLLLGRYNYYIGSCGTIYYMDLGRAFEERTMKLWSTWPVTTLFELIKGMNVDEGPECLWNALRRCVETKPEISWDGTRQEWVYDEGAVDKKVQGRCSWGCG